MEVPASRSRPAAIAAVTAPETTGFPVPQDRAPAREDVA